MHDIFACVYMHESLCVCMYQIWDKLFGILKTSQTIIIMSFNDKSNSLRLLKYHKIRSYCNILSFLVNGLSNPAIFVCFRVLLLVGRCPVF